MFTMIEKGMCESECTRSRLNEYSGEGAAQRLVCRSEDVQHPDVLKRGAQDIGDGQKVAKPAPRPPARSREAQHRPRIRDRRLSVASDQPQHRLQGLHAE